MAIRLMLISLCGCAADNLSPEEYQARQARIQEFALQLQVVGAVLQNYGNPVDADFAVRLRSRQSVPGGIPGATSAHPGIRAPASSCRRRPAELWQSG